MRTSRAKALAAPSPALRTPNIEAMIRMMDAAPLPLPATATGLTDQAAISIRGLTKIYDGAAALDGVDLDIKPGEIFALLGPNGAGKTTLISIVCGIARASGGTVLVDGHDNVRDYRIARQRIGLVPQEMSHGRVRKRAGDGELSAAAFSASRPIPPSSKKSCAT